MRVLLAPSAFAPHRGGVEELTLQLALALRADGHDARVVTMRHPDTLPVDDEVDGVPVRRLAFPAPRMSLGAGARYLAGRRSVLAELDALGWHPDVAHVQCASVQLPHVARWARRHRVPLVVTTQGETVMDADELYRHSVWMRRHFRRAAARAAALTACSTWTAAQAAALAPAFASAAVVPNGVDPAQWATAAPPAEPLLFAWGRLVPQKGFDRLLSAFEVLHARRGDVRLRVGGDGPERERLTRLAPPGVEFVGALDRAQVRDELERARVAVVPSRIEPFGIVALEALAAGRGLVYAGGTGLVEAAGRCGRAAAADDPHVFAAALAAELDDPTPAALGRAHAATFAWPALARRYLGIYRAAASR